MGVHSSVWYGAVVRGNFFIFFPNFLADVNKIKIGSLTSIGDRSTVHVSSGSVNQKGAFSTTIGDRVTIGMFSNLDFQRKYLNYSFILFKKRRVLFYMAAQSKIMLKLDLEASCMTEQ